MFIWIIYKIIDKLQLKKCNKEETKLVKICFEKPVQYPSPVKAVPILKQSGDTRILGIPTVSDRIARAAAKEVLEPELERIFHKDSYQD